MARQGTVLVIFSHDLLGEGLAARLEGLGVDASAVRSSDAAAARRALHDHPDVVVVETTDAKCLAGIRRLSPNSRVVDVSDSVGPGYPEHALRFDVILDALEDLPG
jgi:DNA-binding NarL/FixJ family response regulator